MRKAVPPDMQSYFVTLLKSRRKIQVSAAAETVEDLFNNIKFISMIV